MDNKYQIIFVYLTPFPWISSLPCSLTSSFYSYCVWYILPSIFSIPFRIISNMLLHTRCTPWKLSQTHTELLEGKPKGRGRNGSVGIATRYGLDDPGIKSQWGREFPHPFRPALGPNKPPITRRTGSFPGVKRPGRDNHPPHLAPGWRRSRAIHLLPLWAFLACSRVNYTFTFQT